LRQSIAFRSSWSRQYAKQVSLVSHRCRFIARRG
jgi:hypothetical protein